MTSTSFYIHPINLYQTSMEAATEVLKSKLPQEYRFEWYLDGLEQVLEVPYAMKDWANGQKLTPKMIPDFKAFLEQQRTLMDGAIVEAEKELATPAQLRVLSFTPEGGTTCG